MADMFGAVWAFSKRIPGLETFFLLVLPAPPGLSSGVPNPAERNNPSNLFWGCLQLSYSLDVPRKLSKKRGKKRQPEDNQVSKSSAGVLRSEIWGAGEKPRTSDFHLCHSTSKPGAKSPIFAIFTRHTGSLLEPYFKSPLVFCLFFCFFKKCLCYLRNEKPPSWEKNIRCVSPPPIFFPFSTTTLSSTVCFSPAISGLPFIHQVIYSCSYLKHRSIASDPGAPPSNSLFWDGAQAIPQLQVSGRVYMGREGGGHFTME